MEVSAPGINPHQVSVDELLNHIQKQLTTDGDVFSGTWNYSINADGKVEFMFYNGLYILSTEEFEELKQKSPDVNWKEYPNDWASDEIDEVIEYLKANDLVPDPKEFDFEEAIQQVKILLTAEPEDAGDGFPSWLQHIPGEEIDKLARGVMKVLDHKEPDSPDEMVDKMLDDQ